MRFLTIMAVLFGFSLTAQARDFVEAQVQYTFDSNQEKQLTRLWDGDAQQGAIIMKVSLSNYREDWHQGGFVVSDNNSPYVSWPELADCKPYNFKGKIVPLYMNEESYLSFELKGPACGNFINIYNYFGVTISFYDVDSADNSNHTSVLRVFVNDTVSE